MDTARPTRWLWTTPDERRAAMRPAVEGNIRASLTRKIDALDAHADLLSDEQRARLLALARGGSE
jgi:hypothetical protein